MTATELSIINIKSIAEAIEKNGYDCNGLLNELSGDVDTQTIDETYKKFIIRTMSGNVKVIVIDCKNDKVKAISFNGIIEGSPKELLEIYEVYREAYSIRDDLYFYFFNEDKKHRRYILSFFESARIPVSFSEYDNRLSNLTLSWD